MQILLIRQLCRGRCVIENGPKQTTQRHETDKIIYRYHIIYTNHITRETSKLYMCLSNGFFIFVICKFRTYFKGNAHVIIPPRPYLPWY